MSSIAADEGKNPFALLLEENGATMDLSTAPSADEILNSEPSGHLPEKRNRRKSDRDSEVVARLYSALEAIDRGETYTGEENEDAHLMQDCYRQF